MNSSSPSWPPHVLGAWGEAEAVRLLVSRGWSILDRGYRLGRREIDIVAARRGVLAFVEVKTRHEAPFGPPEAAVDWRKRAEIEAVASDYLMRHVQGETDVRFDVVAIVVRPDRTIVRIEHIEDAWRPGS